jgi:hypothetical protein
MTTTECFILFGPMLAFSIGAIIAFGIVHYNDIKSI